MAIPKITGRVEIVVNGTIMLNKEGAVATGIFKNGEVPVEREEVLGDTGLHGFVEKPVIAMLETTVSDRDDFSFNTLADINENGTIIFRSIGSGKAYVMINGTSTGNYGVTAGMGETPLVFKGAAWEEIVQ